MSSFNKYIQDTTVELKHVAWPTRMQTIVYTALVIGISIAVALMIGFFDFFLSRGVEIIVSHVPQTSTPVVQTTKIPVTPSTSTPGTNSNGTPSFNILPKSIK